MVPVSKIPPQDRSNTEITVVAPPETSGETTAVNVVVITGTGGYSGESPADRYTYYGCPCSEAPTTPPPPTCQLDCVINDLGDGLTVLGGASYIASGSDALGSIALGDLPFATESTTFTGELTTGFLGLFGATDSTAEVALLVPVLLDMPVLAVVGGILVGIGIGVLL